MLLASAPGCAAADARSLPVRARASATTRGVSSWARLTAYLHCTVRYAAMMTRGSSDAPWNYPGLTDLRG